jgi:beta-glucosidase
MMDYDITKGRTYMYCQEEPLFEFGYGLSFTSFEYSKFAVSRQVLNPGGEISVQVDIKNTGTLAGDEVVQLYISHMDSKVRRPQIELKGFMRVNIRPGETQSVTLPLKSADLAYWDEKFNAFTVEEDKISIMLGSSSKNIK